jgi:dimeric dUTPase (all-alpha-NTP-PPase superfamily)
MALSLETLNYLQEEQKKLDIFIHQRNELEMKDTFYLRKIALLVEIGEVANELKSFKY